MEPTSEPQLVELPYVPPIGSSGELRPRLEKSIFSAQIAAARTVPTYCP